MGAMNLNNTNLAALLWVVLLSLFSSPSFATQTICKPINQDIPRLKGLVWNDETMTAKIKTFAGDEQTGKITSIRKHAYPTHRVIGVTYKVIKGARHIDTTIGNVELDCLSM
jgi:hypothetical protein